VAAAIIRLVTGLGRVPESIDVGLALAGVSAPVAIASMALTTAGMVPPVEASLLWDK